MEKDFSFLSEQGKNLAEFTFEVLKRATANGGASLVVSDKIQRERLEICKNCPFYDDLKHLCKRCGCNIGTKVKFSLDSCPIDKWQQSNEDWIREEYENIFNNLDKEIPKNIPTEPVFPNPNEHNLNPGDRYEWNYKQWEWNGNEWIRLTNS